MGPRVDGIMTPPKDDAKDSMLHVWAKCVDNLLGDKGPLPGITVRVWEFVTPDR